MEIPTNNFDQLLQIIKGILFLIPQLLIVICICYYISKKGLKTDAILMVIGTSVGLLISIFYQLVPILFFDDIQPDKLTIIYDVTGIFSFFSGLLFAIGFYLLISTHIKQTQHRQTTKN